MRKSENRRIGAGACKSRKLRQSAAQEPAYLPGGKIAGRIECVTETAARSRTEPEKAVLPKAAEASADGASPAPAKLSKKFAGDDSATSLVKPLLVSGGALINSVTGTAETSEEATIAPAPEASCFYPEKFSAAAPLREKRGSIDAARASAGGDSTTSSAKPPEMRRIEPEKAAAPALPVLPEAFRVSVGYATAAAEEICGDTAISSGLPDGSLALILSDGMGKGIRAAALSRSVANRLRKNLKAGMAPANAIKEVNSYIVSHSESENFATVDLLMIDRNTQRAKLYKMGAASSFVLREGKVKRFEQAALPIGIIPKIRLTHITMQLRAGDIVLMVSDGVTEAGRESEGATQNFDESCRETDRIGGEAATDCDINGSWLRELLENRTFEELAGTSPRKLARWILAETVKQYGERERDDLTVAVVKALAR